MNNFLYICNMIEWKVTNGYIKPYDLPYMHRLILPTKYKRQWSLDARLVMPKNMRYKI